MLNDAELEFFYFGFYRVLRRYRSTSIRGWLIVFVGCLGFLFGWNFGNWREFRDFVLTTLTIFAGLATVWQNIAALEEYVRIPFPTPKDDVTEEQSIISEIRGLMKEVDDGGWQEAFAAIGQLNEIQVKNGLPKLE